MTAHRSVLGRLVLVVVALAAIAMHTGLSGPCAEPGSPAAAASVMVVGGSPARSQLVPSQVVPSQLVPPQVVPSQVVPSHRAPAAPPRPDHAGGQVCSAPMPPHGPVLAGAMALLVPASGLLAALRPRGPLWSRVAPRWRPPQLSSLCVWRI